MVYDNNGNIRNLTRKNSSGGIRESLGYTYAGNRLSSISGTYNGIYKSGNFSYDANGNMTSDGLRELTVTYFDELNLPKQYYQNSTNKVDYTYDAGGNKWSKTATVSGTASTTLYDGTFIYENGSLKKVLTSEGYYDPSAVLYYYYLKDHLGNTRLTFHYSGTTAVVDQEVEYYPFGSLFTENNLDKNKYLYNGKELNDEFFENYDYGARFYDAELGRWHVVDPLAEKYYSSTPYSYVESNPIVFIDPSGEDKVVAIVYNQRRTTDKALWAVEVAYDIDKGQGTYKGMIKGGDYSGNFQGKFNLENKSNYLNANLFTKDGAIGLYHQYQDGKQDFGLTDANAQDFSFDQRWTEKGTKVPTSVATTIADAFDILNEVSVEDLPLGEAGADAVNKKFKELNGTVEYIKGEDGNHSFRFTVNGTDISFKIDYIITKDEKKDDEE